MLFSRRLPRAAALVVVAATAASLGTGLTGLTPASAATDTQAPQLTSLSVVARSTVDVSTGAEAVGVSMHVTDDSSGLSNATVVAHCSTGCGTSSSLTAQGMTFSAGQPTDEQATLSIVVPQSVGNGSVWTVDQVSLTDNAGNTRTYAPTGEALPVTAPTFTVTNNPETTPPSVTSVQVVGTTPIDVTTVDKAAQFLVHIDDAGSGVDDSTARLTLTGPPTGDTAGTQPTRQVYLNRVGGTVHSGDYEGWTWTFGLNDVGTWAMSVQARDFAGNPVNASDPSWTFDVTSATDSAGPQLTDGPTPATTDAAAGDDVSMTTSITDDATGFSNAYGYFSYVSDGSSSSAPAVTGFSWSFTRDALTSGSTYVSTLHIPTGASGTYQLSSLSLYDRANHSSYYQTNGPAGLSLPTVTVTVTPTAQDTATPTVASLTVQPSTLSIRSYAGNDNYRPATAYVTVDDPADGSGFDHGTLDVQPPTSSLPTVTLAFDAGNRVSGDAHAGTYRVQVPPTWATTNVVADGTYAVTDVNLWSTSNRDGSTPDATVDAAALDAIPGATRTFTVDHNGNNDTTRPTISSIDVQTPHVDTTAADQHVQVAVHAVDPGVSAGISQLDLTFRSVTSGATVRQAIQPTLQSGDDTDGVSLMDVTVPRGSTPGDWQVYSAWVYDANGNSTSYTLPSSSSYSTGVDLTTVGGTHVFTNDAASGDTTAPTVKAITVNDTEPLAATDGSSYRVRGTIELLDDLSGPNGASIDLVAPQGVQTAAGSTWTAVSGSGNDVTYDWSIDLPARPTTGTWTFDVYPHDLAGNSARVQAASFPSGVKQTVAVTGSADHAAPTLVSLDVPSSVDVRSGPQTVVGTLHVTDDISGLASIGGYGTNRYLSQNGAAVVTLEGTVNGSTVDQDYYADVVAGTPTDVIMQVGFPFQQWGSAGDWTVKKVVLTDAAGNRSGDIDTSSHVITVTGLNDTAPPTLNSITMTVDHTDLDSGNATVTISADLSDDVSGVAYARVEMGRPGSDSGGYADLMLDPDTGRWTGTQTIAQYRDAGTWTPGTLYTGDNSGNTTQFTADQLVAAGAPAGFTFTGTSDTTNPVLQSFTLSPKTVSIDGAAATTTATLHVTDDASGLGWAYVTLLSPSGYQSASASLSSDNRVSGTATDGTYQVDLPIPADAEAGEWTVSDVAIQDVAGNYVDVPAGSLPDGSDLAITVTNPNAASYDGVIHGTVTGPTADTPLAGASVSVCSTSSERCTYRTTAADGTWSATGLPDSDYVVYVTAPGVTDYDSTQSNVNGLYGNPDHTAQVDVTITPPTPMPTGVTVNGQQSTGSDQVVPTVFWQSPVDLALDGCAGGTATYAITGEDGSTISSDAMSEASPGHYTAEAAEPYPAHGTVHVSMSVTGCPSGSPTTAAFTMYIDPSGNVVDTHGDPVAGATVTLLRSDTLTGTYTQVENGSATMSPANRTNPDTTDSAGHYGWDVMPGYYKVTARKADCYAPNSYNSASNTVQPLVTSAAQQIPPAVTNLDLTLDCDNIAPVAALAQSATSAKAGDTVHLDASGSRDANGTVANYTWDFGDGSPAQVTTAAAVDHVYAAAGTFTPTVTVTDDQGGANAAPGTPITVAAPAPVATAPSQVTGLSAVTGVHSVALTWTAPSANGSPITGYTVDVTPAGQHLTTTGTHVTVTGLTAGQSYTFTVAAVNGVGASSPATTTGVAGAVAGKPSVSIGSAPTGYVPTGSGSVSFATTIDPQASVKSLTCAVDGGAAATCASPFAVTGLGDGSHTVTVTVTDTDGNVASASRQWVVDTTAPSATQTGPSVPTMLVPRFTVSWAGADANGVAGYDVRYRQAAWNGGLGGYVPWQTGTAATSATFTGRPGTTYCFSTRAHDSAGNTSAWSAERCTTLPLDDRSLKASSGWSKRTGRGYYAGTVLQAASKGRTLTLKSVPKSGRVVLVVADGKGFGSVDVLYNGKRVKTVSLVSRKKLVYDVLVTLPKVTKAGTAIVLRTTGKQPVSVDGLLLAR